MSNPTETDRKACRRKRRFDTRIKAEVNALGAMNTRAKGKRIFVYQCPVCHGWHLTRSPHRYPESQLWPTKPALQAPPPETSPSRRRASTDKRSASKGQGGSVQR